MPNLECKYYYSKLKKNQLDENIVPFSTCLEISYMCLPFQMCFYLFVVIVIMNFTRKCRADLDDSRSCRWFLTDRCTHWTLFLRHRKVRINTDWLQFNSVTLFRATHRVQCDIFCCLFFN